MCHPGGICTDTHDHSPGGIATCPVSWVLQTAKGTMQLSDSLNVMTYAGL